MKTMRRPQITVGELVNHLLKADQSIPVYVAPSDINYDEPEETQEFIADDEKIECVSLEFCSSYATIGWRREGQ